MDRDSDMKVSLSRFLKNAKKAKTNYDEIRRQSRNYIRVPDSEFNKYFKEFLKAREEYISILEYYIKHGVTQMHLDEYREFILPLSKKLRFIRDKVRSLIALNKNRIRGNVPKSEMAIGSEVCISFRNFLPRTDHSELSDNQLFDKFMSDQGIKIESREDRMKVRIDILSKFSRFELTSYGFTSHDIEKFRRLTGIINHTGPVCYLGITVKGRVYVNHYRMREYFYQKHGYWPVDEELAKYIKEVLDRHKGRCKKFESE